MYGKYSVTNMLKDYRDNKHLIDSYLQKKSIEGFSINSQFTNSGTGLVKVLGISLFLLIFVFILSIWVYAIYSLIAQWNNINFKYKTLAILGLVTPLGPIVSLLAICYGKSSIN